MSSLTPAIRLCLDLRDLTPAKVREAMNHLGECHYRSPCIIGVLIPPDKREWADNIGPTNGVSNQIDTLTAAGFISFATPAQLKVATDLQRAFDLHDRQKLKTILARELDIHV